MPSVSDGQRAYLLIAYLFFTDNIVDVPCTWCTRSRSELRGKRAILPLPLLSEDVLHNYEAF